MTHDEDMHDELPPHAAQKPGASTPGVKVYDRPARTLPPAWLLVLLALLMLAGVWLAFTYLF
jgi:hypothetical protein